MARSPRKKIPSTEKELYHNILYRLETIELSLKIRSAFANNPSKDFVDSLP